MNQYPYHSNSLVAPALLVLIVVCIAGAVLANSDFLYRPEARSENLVSTAMPRQFTQTALANKSAQEAGIARQTQIAQQLTALPQELAYQEAISAPTMTAAAAQRAAQQETFTNIALLLVIVLVPVAVVAFLAALSFFGRDIERKHQEAKAREREAEAAILQVHDRWKNERNPQKSKVAPVNHPPVSDGGRKTNLNGDTRNMWPDDEESKGKRDLPLVE